MAARLWLCQPQHTLEMRAMRTMGQGWMVVETIAYEGVGDPVLPRGKVEATFNEVKVAIKSEVRLINDIDHPRWFTR